MELSGQSKFGCAPLGLRMRKLPAWANIYLQALLDLPDVLYTSWYSAWRTTLVQNWHGKSHWTRSKQWPRSSTEMRQQRNSFLAESQKNVGMTNDRTKILTHDTPTQWHLKVDAMKSYLSLPKAVAKVANDLSVEDEMVSLFIAEEE